MAVDGTAAPNELEVAIGLYQVLNLLGGNPTNQPSSPVPSPSAAPTSSASASFGSLSRSRAEARVSILSADDWL